MPDRDVHVIGASGRSGQALCRALQEGGQGFVPVVRDAARWQATAGDRAGNPAADGAAFSPLPRIADLTDGRSLAAALSDASAIVCCAHARHAAAVIAAAPSAARLVFLGSTRKFTRWPDMHGNGVLAGEAAFLASGRSGVMLHPTMIYGANGENNVQRLAALLRRVPVLPLPNGGRALVQPIHQHDVTRCILAALAREWDWPSGLVIAGPRPLTYASFVQAVARAAGLRPPRIVPFPAAPLVALAEVTRWLPGLPHVGAAEVRRLLEDKAFDIGPMRDCLGVTPISLEEGLARTFHR